MDYRTLPIGISDFAEMNQKEFYYVDKTLMIRDLLNNIKQRSHFLRVRGVLEKHSI